MSDEQTATATRPSTVPVTGTVPVTVTVTGTVPAQASRAGATATRPAAPATRPAAPLVPTRDDFTFAAPPARGTTRTAAPSRASTGLVWMATTTAVAVLTGFFVLVVSGRVFTEGPVVLVLTRTHGIHLGDLFALGAWSLAVSGLLASALASTPLRRR